MKELYFVSSIFLHTNRKLRAWDVCFYIRNSNKVHCAIVLSNPSLLQPPINGMHIGMQLLAKVGIS